MSPVTLDLVTIKEHFVHRAAGLSADVSKEQLVNVVTGAQYARPVRPGQFSVRGLWTGWDHVPHKLPRTKDQIFGCCPQVLQGEHSVSVTGSKRPGAHLASTKCHLVSTREKTVWCAVVRWGPEGPQTGCEHPKRFVEARSQHFLLWSCVRCDWQAHYLVDLREWPPADGMEVLSRQHHNCLVFYGTRDHRQGDSNAACKTPNTCCKNRYKPTRRRADLLPHFYV